MTGFFRERDLLCLLLLIFDFLICAIVLFGTKLPMQNQYLKSIRLVKQYEASLFSAKRTINYIIQFMRSLVLVNKLVLIVNPKLVLESNN